MVATEQERLRRLAATNLLDTESEDRFDRLTRLARNALGTKIALVSLVDADRQWFKSRIGLDVQETPRSVSFCDHAIRTPDDVMVVLDARTDSRFRDNPLVTGEPHIAFYAGAPLVTVDGLAIGTLCLIDSEPRASFDERERAILTDIARSVMTEIEVDMRRQQIDDLELINHELQHRMGNLYAQVSGVVSLLGKSENDVETLMRRLNSNIRTMAKVQALFAANQYRAVPFAELAENVLQPFEPALETGQIVIENDGGLIVSERGAFLLTLVLNELATNSTKHGALGTEDGKVSLRAKRDEAVVIEWSEKCSIPGPGETGKAGFGSRILRDIAPRGLMGTASLEWLPTGLVYRLTADPAMFETAQ